MAEYAYPTEDSPRGFEVFWSVLHNEVLPIEARGWLQRNYAPGERAGNELRFYWAHVCLRMYAEGGMPEPPEDLERAWAVEAMFFPGKPND